MGHRAASMLIARHCRNPSRLTDSSPRSSLLLHRALRQSTNLPKRRTATTGHWRPIRSHRPFTRIQPFAFSCQQPALWKHDSRWLSSTTTTTTTLSSLHATPTTTTTATPPLPIRVALVATTTAIGTPAFPVVGLVNFGLRHVVLDSSLRQAILGATTLLGSIGALITFAAMDVLPLAYSYGQLFLPFAMVNGGLAGTAYVILDVALGTVKMASMPWTGAAMGAFVGLMGPVTGLYDHSFQWFYDMPDADGWFTYLLSNAVMLPISVTTGAVVGLTMHPLLYFPIVGIRGIHWAKFSAPLLAAATAFMAHLYHADYYNSDIFPPETFLTLDEKRNLQLVQRFHAQRLQVEDWGLKSGYQPLGTGNQARESVKRKLEAVKDGTRRTDIVFDSKRKAWLHYVTNGAFGDHDAISLESIPGDGELSLRGLRHLSSDGAVAFIMVKGSRLSPSRVREGLMHLANQLQLQQQQSSSSSSRRQLSNGNIHRTVDRMDLASNGIVLLLEKRRKMDGSRDSNESQPQRQLLELERNIRTLVPGVMIYAREESAESRGCSVESQLQEYGWKGIGDEDLKKQISLDWQSGWNHVLTSERTAAVQRQITFAVIALSTFLLHGLFG